MLTHAKPQCSSQTNHNQSRISNSSLSTFLIIAVAAIVIFCDLDQKFISSVTHRLGSHDRRLIDEVEAINFPGYKKGGSCIAFLMTKKQEDYLNLKVAIKSLDNLKSDDSEKPTPVLVFNDGSIDETQRRDISSCTSRPIKFPVVDLTMPPIGLDSSILDGPNANSLTHDLDNYQKVRFWVSDIWKHPYLDDFTTVMRMSPDACFSTDNEDLPNFKHPGLVYHSQFFGYTFGTQTNRNVGLIDFTEQYMKKEGISPSNIMFWQLVKHMWDKKKALPVFNTEFEVIRKPWMQHPSVAKWHNALIENEPYGILRYGWSDAMIRFITALLFSDNTRIDTSAMQGHGPTYTCADISKSITENSVTAPEQNSPITTAIPEKNDIDESVSSSTESEFTRTESKEGLDENIVKSFESFVSEFLEENMSGDSPDAEYEELSDAVKTLEGNDQSDSALRLENIILQSEEEMEVWDMDAV